MQPLADSSQNALRKIRFVLTDIDDTLTENGLLPAASYQALERLQKAGKKVIPITGRPAGWCDHIARMWPVNGVIGENGAFFFSYNHQSKKMQQGVSTYYKKRNRKDSELDITKPLIDNMNLPIISIDGSFTR
jgi:HAD superfamily hydrolase (TIGR01484 family)